MNYNLEVTPMKKWRCSKGHEFEASYENSMNFTIGGEVSTLYCLICFRELIAKNCGVLVEVGKEIECDSQGTKGYEERRSGGKGGG